LGCWCVVSRVSRVVTVCLDFLSSRVSPEMPREPNTLGCCGCLATCSLALTSAVRFGGTAFEASASNGGSTATAFGFFVGAFVLTRTCSSCMGCRVRGFGRRLSTGAVLAPCTCHRTCPMWCSLSASAQGCHPHVSGAVGFGRAVRFRLRSMNVSDFFGNGCFLQVYAGFGRVCLMGFEV